jgi:ABC-type transport system involved in multi-copper enzyme maturation permease subunit
MSSTPQATPEAQTPALARRSTVVMGRLGFFNVLFRSIGGELYKIRRRRMSKVLLPIGISIIILGFIVIALPAVITYNSEPASFLPPSCTFTREFKIPGACLDHAPTRADLAKAEQIKQDTVRSSAAPLHVPDSFVTAAQIINFIGLLLLVILAGTIVGGEYSVGTIRLLLTRGPTRTQFLLAKIGAILVCIVIIFLLLLPIGMLTGAVLLPILVPGIAISFSFFTGAWLLHALLYLLAAILGLFMYTMIALCLAIMGKATAAGVAGAIVWWVLENIIGGVLQLLASSNKGAVGDFLKAVPDYFIGNNVTALLGNQSQYLTGDSPSALSDLHAILVLAGYLVLFIGVAWWINRQRDVTN